MTRDVVTVPSAATVADALDTLNLHTIRHLPVLDDGRVVGILSDRDLRRAMTGRPDETTVADVLTADPVTVGPDDRVETAARLLVEHDVGCVPVVAGGRLVGIVTASDLLRAYVEHGEAPTPDRAG
jgi:acetoin utilization protein AcuB